jgi:hypothetical protein
MHSRRHYREIAKELSLLNDPAAQAGVRAINDLLEERARLSKRVLRALGPELEKGKTEPKSPKKWWWPF